MAEFLLEVGCEEIPAGWLGGLSDQIRQRFVEAATREHLAPESAQAFATPRRLVVAADVRARQEDREEKLWGPSLKVAKDAGGKWTGAAQGFAKKCGVRPEELQEAPKDPAAPDERYLLFMKRTAGRAAGDVLPGVIASVLRALAFPKRMSWDAWIDDGKGAFPFGRPIRWIVALLGGESVPFAIHALKDGAKGDAILRSSGTTHGHRFLPRGDAGGALAVRSLADLRQKLREHFVLLDPPEREKRIEEGLAAQATGPIQDDHGLLAEWRDLVEYPTVVFGTIPAEFRTLPTEVLETVLVHHQKYIPLTTEGRIVSRFAAVTNTDGAAAAEMVRGMERVVVARLRDAAFFFQEDLKKPLAERVAELAGVTYHQKLGSYKDKADRMLRLVDLMGADMGLLTKPEHQAARDAALLCKADLTTLMVREFPELQGVMGAIYLRAQGTPWENVVRAVRWHYHPVSIEEGSPPAKALAGSDATVFGAVSLADKLDTLAGYFGLGLAPSGSSDPYGLRRAAQGAVRVLLDFWTADAVERRPSLSALIRQAIAGYELFDTEKTARNLEGFFLDRIAYVFTTRGFPVDEVDAVLYPEDDDPSPVSAKGPRRIQGLEDVHDAFVRLKALHQVRGESPEDFANLAVAFKRAKNILAKQPPAPVDPALFSEVAERELHAAVSRLGSTNGAYESRLRALATLRAPVDRFFDDVLVMAEDPKVRANRLGLLSQALSLFYRIADISKLGG